MTRHLITLLWRTLALAALALGLLGVFVPGLPTVPFLLVAAWAGSRGWTWLEQWLLNHPATAPTSGAGANAAPCRAAPSGRPAS